MPGFKKKLSQRLSERKSSGLYRHRKVLDSAQDTEIFLDGEKLISFCSNDYLGLANHPEIINAFKNALDRFGVGSGASHLITGHSSCHHALEEELAAFTGRSRALVFSSGYMANVGVITALIGKQDYVLEDRLNHASLLDGGIYSGAKFKRYPHLDTKSLNASLSEITPGGQTLIVSDGVFSMDGDQAELSGLIQSAENNNASLMIDDAHGVGCLGKTGGGIVEYNREQGVEINENNLQILVGTFGKAFGTAGAFVAGSEELIESLIQFCRPYVYTTAFPPAQAEATRCSLKILQAENWRRENLQNHINVFRKHCEELGFNLTNSNTPIQAVVLGSVEKTLQASKALQEKGIVVSAIRPPTVPKGTARLRFTFSATHTSEHLQALCDGLDSIAFLAESEE